MGSDATLNALPAPDAEQRERLFFLAMAVAITATVLTGFGAFALLGISSVRAPWWVHVQAVSFMAWIGLYLTQNLLVFRGDTQTHRRLGRAGVWLAAWMVLLGLVLTPVTVAVARVPPFFTPAFFLALDWVNIVCFGALVYAALHLRTLTDWHRRLMLCATISVMAPACGRLLALAGWTSAWSIFGMLSLYVLLAMAADFYIRGRIHQAYLWGLGAILAMAPLATGIAELPLLQSIAAHLAA